MIAARWPPASLPQNSQFPRPRTTRRSTRARQPLPLAPLPRCHRRASRRAKSSVREGRRPSAVFTERRAVANPAPGEPQPRAARAPPPAGGRGRRQARRRRAGGRRIARGWCGLLAPPRRRARHHRGGRPTIEPEPREPDPQALALGVHAPEPPPAAAARALNDAHGADPAQQDYEESPAGALSWMSVVHRFRADLEAQMGLVRPVVMAEPSEGYPIRTHRGDRTTPEEREAAFERMERLIKLDRKALRQFGRRWAPYRSVAACYSGRSRTLRARARREGSAGTLPLTGPSPVSGTDPAERTSPGRCPCTGCDCRCWPRDPSRRTRTRHCDRCG